MAASEELYGEGHPATYDQDDPNNPTYDPESRWYDEERAREFRLGLARTALPKMVRIELSGEFYGDDIENHGDGILVSEDVLYPKNEPDGIRDF